MNPSLLRQVWHIITEIQNHWVSEISDLDFIEEVLSQLEQSRELSMEENQLVRAYLYSKTCLIRENQPLKQNF